MQDDDKAALRRIQDRLAAVGMSETKASNAAFGHGAAIKNMREGKAASPRAEFWRKLAPVLDTTPEWLAFGVGGPESPTRRPVSIPGLRVVGEVAAGTWLEIESEIDYPVYDPIAVPPDPRWPADSQFALLVRGTSINRVAPDGAYLQCVDLRAAPRPLDEDELVVVERRRNGGQLLERTAKRYRRRGALVELWPDSDDERWRDGPPIVIDPENTDESTEVVVLGFVTWVHAPLHRSTSSRPRG